MGLDQLRSLLRIVCLLASGGWPLSQSLHIPSPHAGRPKGVLVQHGGFARVTAELVKVFGCQPGDKVFQFLACVFVSADPKRANMHVLHSRTVCLDGWRSQVFVLC